MPAIDWKWLIVGLLLGWLVLPNVQAMFLRRSKPAKAA